MHLLTARLLAAASLILIAIVPAKADTLATAKLLGETTFKGWIYGSGAKKTDCVGFINAVAIQEHGAKVDTPEIKKIILIQQAWAATPAQIDEAVTRNDPTIKGVVLALVDKLALAKAVAPQDVQAGDYIQYWMLKSSDNHWFGHTGIVSKVWEDSAKTKRIAIFGFHESKPADGAVENDYKPTGLALKDSADRKIFIARPN